MGYFPLCMDIRGKTVLLVGRGPQTDEKLEKLAPFGPEIRRLDTLSAENLTDAVAFVVAGDLPMEAARQVSDLCAEHRVHVNVVDRPALSSFFFPALTVRGDLTVSVSTGGRSPGAAAYLSRQLEQTLPDRTEEILDWLADLRRELYERHPRETARAILHRATARALSQGRPLSEAELIE